MAETGNFLTESELDEVFSAAGDNDPEVRAEGIKALAKISQSDFLSIIIDAYGDKDREVRMAVIESFREIDPTDRTVLSAGISVLIDALDDVDVKIRTSAAEALIEYSDSIPEYGVEALYRLLNYKDDFREVTGVVAVNAAEKVKGSIFDAALAAEMASIVLTGVNFEMPRYVVDKLIDNLKTGPFAARRGAAAALGVLAETEVDINALIKALEDEDEWVRETVVWALGLVGDKLSEKQKQLLAYLVGDEDHSVRKNAIFALKRTDQYQTFDELFSLFRNNSTNAKITALQILRSKGDKIQDDEITLVKEVFLEYRYRSNCNAIGIECMDFFSKIGSKTTTNDVQFLIDIIEDDKIDGNVRRSAFSAFGKLLQWLQERDLTIIFPTLIKFLNNDDFLFVEQIRSIILNIRNKFINPNDQVRQLLITHMEDLLIASSSKDPGIRKNGVLVLSILGKKLTNKMVSMLIKAVQDQNNEVRKIALVALGNMGESIPKEGVSCLERNLYSDDEEIRTTALDAIGKIGSKVPFFNLLNILHGKNTDMAQNVAEMLGTIRSKVPERFITALVKDLHSKNEHHRFIASLSLGQLRERVTGIVLHKLIDLCLDEDANVRDASVAALGFIGKRIGSQGKEALLRALHDKVWFVRYEAVWALGQMKENRYADAILDLVDDEHEEVRQIAKETLRHLGASPENEETTPAAIHISNVSDNWMFIEYEIQLGSSKEYEREKAIEELLNLEGVIPQRIIDLVLLSLGDSDYGVRETAIAFLKKIKSPELEIAIRKSTEYLRHNTINLSSHAAVLSVIETELAEAVGELGYGDKEIFNHLAQLLTWPFWEVRFKACEAIGQIRREIPDQIIERLYELCQDPESNAVRQAAENALVEVLSVDTIEDDQLRPPVH